jgi:hypothetical protein
MESTDTIYLRQGEKAEGLTWTLCEAPAEDTTTMTKAQRAQLEEFRNFPFPMTWEAMIAHMVAEKGHSYKSAQDALGRASSAGIVHCPDRNGLWVRGDRTLREQPEF